MHREPLALSDSYLRKPKVMSETKLLKWCAPALLALALSGCNTIEGAGEDIEAVGDEMQEESRENR